MASNTVTVTLTRREAELLRSIVDKEVDRQDDRGDHTLASRLADISTNLWNALVWRP